MTMNDNDSRTNDRFASRAPSARVPAANPGARVPAAARPAATPAAQPQRAVTPAAQPQRAAAPQRTPMPTRGAAPTRDVGRTPATPVARTPETPAATPRPSMQGRAVTPSRGITHTRDEVKHEPVQVQNVVTPEVQVPVESIEPAVDENVVETSKNIENDNEVSIESKDIQEEAPIPEENSEELESHIPEKSQETEIAAEESIAPISEPETNVVPESVEEEYAESEIKAQELEPSEDLAATPDTDFIYPEAPPESIPEPEPIDQEPDDPEFEGDGQDENFDEPQNSEPEPQPETVLKRPAVQLGPVIEKRPMPPELARANYILDHSAYRSECRTLMRQQKWEHLAEVMKNALDFAEWATLPEVRISMLKELAKLYGDQLKKPEKEEHTYIALLTEDPTNEDAIRVLSENFEARREFDKLHQVFCNAVSGTWEHSERIYYTQRAVDVALEQMNDKALVVQDWEHLWEIGEQSDDVQALLMNAYRDGKCWDALASFIAQKCKDWGHKETLGTREIIEIYISGKKDPQNAQNVIDAMLEKRPSDPLILLQEVNVCRLNGNFDRLAQLSRIDGLRTDIARDIQRAAAEVLWNCGERELSVQAYDAILECAPDDHDALEAKEKYYSESGNYEALCNFYEGRANKQLNEEIPDKAVVKDFLCKSADVAENFLNDTERAISIWKRIIEENPEDTAAYNTLVRLYDAIDNVEGIASSLEGLLALTSRPVTRKDILSRLGDLYLQRIENFDKAEQCWQKVLAYDPMDTSVNEELSKIYARRGDFDALDVSLTQQIRNASGDQRFHLANSKASYLRDNRDTDPHTAAAWEIVLDCNPDNTDALENFAQCAGELRRPLEMLGAWNHEIHQIDNLDERVELGLKIAKATETYGSHAETLATYLNILHWNPESEDALTAIENLATEDEKGIVAAVLEVACTHKTDNLKKCTLLKRVFKTIPEDKLSKRIELLRRMIALGDKDALEQLKTLAQTESTNKELFATYTRLAAECDNPEIAENIVKETAKHCELRLNDTNTAFALTLTSAFDKNKVKELLPELERLAANTNRWEDLLAVLETLSGAQFSRETRLEAINKKLGILLSNVHDNQRAMEEFRRLLAMDPENEVLLEDAEDLAESNQLSDAILAIYGELWDVCEDIDKRSVLCDKRYRLYNSVLNSPKDALNELILNYRLAPNDMLEAKLREVATSNNLWHVVLPLLDSQKRSANTIDPETIMGIAAIYDNQLNDPHAATEIYSLALTQEPANEEYLQALQTISEKTQEKGRFVQALRIAAATANYNHDDDTSLKLYQQVADFYKNNLQDPERCIDIQSKILNIKPDNIPSLDALIEWHKSNQSWSELRSEIKNRIAVANPEEDVCSLWIQVADLSRNHLNDLEGAFDAYAKILTVSEDHQEARQGVSELTGTDIGPEVTVRRLKLELRLAKQEERPEILLKLADTLDKELKQTDAARETLEQLLSETGALGQGFEPLCELYKRQNDWIALLNLLIQRADALFDDANDDEAAKTLADALKLSDQHLNDPKLVDELIKKLHDIHPQDLDTFERYAAIVRRNQDWDAYAKLLSTAKNVDGIEPFLRCYDFELARTKFIALEQVDEAIAAYKKLSTNMGKTDINGLFGQATIALKQNNIDAYVALMEQVSQHVEPVWGAIIHCHLAEVCDEKGKPALVANYYRSARTLDPNNNIASESLRSIGRRLKTWRNTSSILPLENEKELPWEVRSQKLRELAKAADSNNEKREWLWKAIAVNHDNVDAWEDLAVCEAEDKRMKEEYSARFGQLGAFERTQPFNTEYCTQKAQILRKVALAAEDCCNSQKAEAIYRQAYALAPSFAPTAIAVADLENDLGNTAGAFKIYNNILKDKSIKLDKDTRQNLLYNRGVLAMYEKNYELALADLRETVLTNPLHCDALLALSETYEKIDHPLLALHKMQQALIVTHDNTVAKGDIQYKMGRIWSDNLGDAKEAGIYYEGALANGTTDAELIERCLEIYRQAGRNQEALELVDKLTQTTTDAKVLAGLWCTRGELIENISMDQATEAYDMALSYVPGLSRALDGLERMLAASNEWNQLAELLEGRLEMETDPKKVAPILMRLSELYSNQLNDNNKATSILFKILEIQPSAEVIEKLLSQIPDDMTEDRIDLMQKSILYCDGKFQKAIQLAMFHLRQGRRLQAWAILSTLRVLLSLDPELKEILNDLRSEFEKSDTVLYDKIPEMMPVLTDEQFAILDAINSIKDRVEHFGPATLDKITANAAEITENTPNGKVFHQFKTALELESIQLWRAADLSEPLVVVDADPTIVCIRTDILQKASGNELQFWLAKAITLAHPDNCTVAAMPQTIRENYAPAILAAVGYSPVTPQTDGIVKKITAAIPKHELSAIAASMAQCDKDKLLQTAQNFWTDILMASDTVAALTVADMRTVWRAEARIYTDIPEQRTIKTLQEIDKLFKDSPVMTKILASYTGEDLSKLL